MIFPVTKILGGVALAAMIAAAGLGWLLKGSYEANGALEQANEQLLSVVEGLNNEVERIDELRKSADSALLRVSREKKRLRESAISWQTEYNKLLQSDIESKKWSIVELPSGVTDILRNAKNSNEEGSSSSSATDVTPRDDDNSAFLWNNERSSTDVRPAA